jgi:hypothetical protein
MALRPLIRHEPRSRAGSGPDGARVRLIRTSLVDPGESARRVETGEGPIWILASEPLDGPAGGT